MLGIYHNYKKDCLFHTEFAVELATPFQEKEGL